MEMWFSHQLKAVLAEKSRLAHALLIKGQRGIGKQGFGLALAQALLCEASQADARACGQCHACTWFANDTHPDFRLLAPATETTEAEIEEGARKVKASPWISIDQVRELHDFINVSSHRGGRKVILVDPAEALNVNAANALLKSLEEPPALTHFILISHRPHRLPRTIVSRCRQLDLRPPDAATALAWLGERGVQSPDVALAQASGAPLLALTASEGDEFSGRTDFLQGIASVDFDPLAVAETHRDLSLERFIGWMQKWTYDIVTLRMLGTVRYNPDLARELATLVKQVDPLKALRLHRKLVRAQRNIHHPLNGRLYIESVLIAYAALVSPARRAA